MNHFRSQTFYPFTSYTFCCCERSFFAESNKKKNRTKHGFSKVILWQPNNLHFSGEEKSSNSNLKDQLMAQLRALAFRHVSTRAILNVWPLRIWKTNPQVYHFWMYTPELLLKVLSSTKISPTLDTLCIAASEWGSYL